VAKVLLHRSFNKREEPLANITERIDDVTKIPANYKKAKLPAPKSVKIEISPRCNYRCGFCGLRTREVQPKWDMDFDFFKRVTREMREAGVEEIGVFYLGESFMNPRLLVDCIAYLKKKLAMPYVFLTSNASMAFPEAVEECMKAGLDSLKWSINAADQEQFEKIMGVSGKLFERALANVQSAWDVRSLKKYKTGLYASSIRYDGEQQVKMEALLAEKVRPVNLTGHRPPGTHQCQRAHPHRGVGLRRRGRLHDGRHQLTGHHLEPQHRLRHPVVDDMDHRTHHVTFT
jgi:uncharacterized Fe-S cluster-containing radical SAM superfamily protein